jgi:hypothetical protein
MLAPLSSVTGRRRGCHLSKSVAAAEIDELMVLTVNAADEGVLTRSVGTALRQTMLSLTGQSWWCR